MDEHQPERPATPGRWRGAEAAERGAEAPERDGARRGPAPRAWDTGSGRPRRPELPEGITAAQLDPAARAQLRTLPGDLADAVARWLVAASREEDPERAYEYAQHARTLAARVGVVRETAGIAAYRAGRWAEALTELRTARRLTGDPSYLPMMADAERALGRFDRALALADDPAARDASRATQVELAIVASGIRRDQGSPAAGVALLQLPELTDGRLRPWSARLFYAYADALLDAGREDEAREWFGRAAAVDTDEETDAAERYEEFDPVLIEDLAEPADEEPGPKDAHEEPSSENAHEEPGPGDALPGLDGALPGPRDPQPVPQGTEPRPNDPLPGPNSSEPVPQDAESARQDPESARQDAESARQDTEPRPNDPLPGPNSSEPARQDAEPRRSDPLPGPESSEPVPQGTEPARQDTEPGPRDSGSPPGGRGSGSHES